MQSNQAVKRILAFVLLATGSALALAHTGQGTPHDHGAFLNGLLHPVSGLDHLVAMLAVGVWSAVALPNKTWQPPLAFVALLTVGTLVGFTGFEPMGMEVMVAGSLLAFGLMIALVHRFKVGLNLWAMLGVIGVFAFFHGVAHGAELPAQQGLLAMLGMVLTTSALHLAGMGVGHLVLRQRKALQQLVGAGVTLLGGYLVSQAL